MLIKKPALGNAIRAWAKRRTVEPHLQLIAAGEIIARPKGVEKVVAIGIVCPITG